MSDGAVARGRLGLYGKLPAKRDFVSMGLPWAVVDPVERWLQSAVASARDAYGADWQDVYLTAPIWNFWIGPRVLDQAVQGALAPSVDKVGRMFPLAIVYVHEAKAVVTPPILRRDDAWYRRAAAALLLCLDDESIDLDRLLAGVPAPQPSVDPDDDGPLTMIGGEDTDAGALFDEIRDRDHQRACARRSYWWTEGRTGEGPAVHVCDGLPKPAVYSTMLMGSSRE